MKRPYRLVRRNIVTGNKYVTSYATLEKAQKCAEFWEKYYKEHNIVYVRVVLVSYN